MRRLTRRQQLAAGLLTVVALIFISIDFTAGSLRNARGGTTGALGSLYRGTDGVFGPARRFVQGIPDVGSNRRQLAELQAANDRLRRQLTEAQVNQATAAQLQALQLQANSANWSLVPVRVIATGPGAGFQWTVTVDAGSTDHVLAGQTVTNGVGLVGRVLSVQAHTSVVLLAADPTAEVGVRDLRSGSLLLTRGAATRGLTAVGLSTATDVHVGDQLVTGPAGSTTYVADLAVGKVTAVATDADGGVSVKVQPAAPQTGLNLLGVVALPVPAAGRPPITPVTAVAPATPVAAVSG